MLCNISGPASRDAVFSLQGSPQSPHVEIQEMEASAESGLSIHELYRLLSGITPIWLLQRRQTCGTSPSITRLIDLSTSFT
jgi:hypothetical protein